MNQSNAKFTVIYGVFAWGQALRVGPKNEIVKRAGLQEISRNCVIPRMDREAIRLIAPSVS